MKIIYVTMQFPVPSETFASLDVESLRQQGQDVSIYGLRPKHVQFDKLMGERGHIGLSVKSFSLFSIFYFFIFLFRHPLMSFSLLNWVFSCNLKSPKHLLKSLILFPSCIAIFRAVFKDKPDVVHLFWGHYPSMVGYLVNKYMPDTVLSMFLGAHDLVTAYPGSTDLSENSDVVFTHSKSNLPMIKRIGIDGSKVNVIVRGTKLDLPVESTLNKFEYLNEPRFLTAARLIEEKGVDDVINIFKSLLKEFPNAILYIAGDGPYRKNLYELVRYLELERSIIFLGHLDQIDLIDYMAKSHFFILMSRYPSERLPNVVKEAMYQKCVIITTNTEGIDELIDNENDGFIVDSTTALNCMKDCLSDSEKSKDIAEQAYLKITNHFDVNISMKNYITLWKKALHRKQI